MVERCELGEVCRSNPGLGAYIDGVVDWRPYCGSMFSLNSKLSSTLSMSMPPSVLNISMGQRASRALLMTNEQ
ncbi:MAG: hypothetical protein ACLT2T_13615 [Bilophila wadsworthia]